MAEKFSFFVRQTLGNLSPETMLFICLCALLFAFLVGVTLSLCVTNFIFLKRLWFFGFCGGVALLQGAHSILFKHSLAYTLFFVGVSVILALPVAFISPRKRKIKKEQKELADFLDKNAKNLMQSDFGREENADTLFEKEQLDIQAPPKTNIPIEKLTVQKQKAVKDDTPDFSHVKNVMERLAYFPLTPFDKRQVKDLEVAIKRIEGGENTAEAKNKINDGLSSLLKIMSKYGV